TRHLPAPPMPARHHSAHRRTAASMVQAASPAPPAITAAAPATRSPVRPAPPAKRTDRGATPRLPAPLTLAHQPSAHQPPAALMVQRVLPLPPAITAAAPVTR